MGHRHQTTDATALKRIITEGVSAKELAKEFGLGVGTIHGWLQTDVAPYWTRCAVEALERRRGRSSKVFLIIEVTNNKSFALTDVIKAMGGEVHLSINF